ncbi:MAG UNVERIFIED_CONTAM: hypothetical protein LVT10_14480 [Anaerolineae bacterium]
MISMPFQFLIVYSCSMTLDLRRTWRAILVGFDSRDRTGGNGGGHASWDQYVGTIQLICF